VQNVTAKPDRPDRHWRGDGIARGIERGIITGKLAEKYHFVCQKLGGPEVFEAALKGRRRRWPFEQISLLMEFADDFGFEKEP
jgi:hypothetical protein